MPTDRWLRLDEIFAEAMTQPSDLRSEFLAQRCGDDPIMRTELAALVAAEAKSSDFLSLPALDVFALQVSREGWCVRPGDRIGAYTVEQRLGAGGMGEVWRARDERLGRDVAIKLLLPHAASEAERERRFQHEARAAGSLNHVNILTVHDVGEHGGAPYLVTECLDGESLRARLSGDALSIDIAVDIALQVSRGLGAAHARGIVHRDLKPENIFVARDGRVKILDFGLATLREPHAQLPEALAARHTQLVGGGTAGYMAPEQIRGGPVDHRADIFALGTVLAEMLPGRQDLSAIVRRCLAESPDDRFATVHDVTDALDSFARARQVPPPPGLREFLRRPVLLGCVLLAFLAIGGAAWYSYARIGRANWARLTAAPEVQRLLNHGDYTEAFLLVRQALQAAPDDPALHQLWLDASQPVDITTDPPGADVELAGYRMRASPWLPMGRTPLDRVRMPRGQFRMRISKAGFQPIDASGSAPGLRYKLDPPDAVPSGMVRVTRGRDSVRFGLVGELDEYWIDRFEVTNRQFKAFVDQGGYRRPEFWRESFVDSNRSLPWHEAIARFRDGTGRPGPATWVGGTYPPGQDDYPVGGVSWYEAAAYAVFAGKSLPTMYHWYRAAALGRFADILTMSNFNGKGPAQVGSYKGLGPFGTYDMAGNVKEWCSTETSGSRFLLGGAWNEPRYMYADYDAKGPFAREPEYGFRLAQYAGPLPAALVSPMQTDALSLDVRDRAPVPDAIFAVYRRQYAYDPAPLNIVVESNEDSETWRKLTVVFDAAYGGERMRAHLFLPKNASPPYQTVVFFPAGDAFRLQDSRTMSLAWASFIIHSGRAFMYPVYKGTYERMGPDANGVNAERDLMIAWSRDLGRAIDYLETRSDIDAARLAFYGVSAGAGAGMVLSAIEGRLATTVLQGAGLYDAPPEIVAHNYAPRIRIPTLLLSGRYDFEVPFESAQQPLFALLGAPAAHKRHRVFDTGHALPMDEVAGEMLPWLDRYLGKVAVSAAVPGSGSSRR